MKMPFLLLVLLFLLCIFLLNACALDLKPSILPTDASTLAAPSLPSSSGIPTSPIETVTTIFTPTIAHTTTPDIRPLPRDWSSWPVIPTPSARAVEIYHQGQRMGVTPNTFSVVGDCQSVPAAFMGIYGTDRNPIGEDHPELLEIIAMFHDSFNHDSVAVRDGLSAPSALDPLWADSTRCSANESPLSCELRLVKPMIVFINLGTVWRAGASADAYEAYLRRIVDQIIASGAVPILTNKADNIEGDYSLNLATAKVAYDYDIPLVNFWLIADSLPNHGLDPDQNNIYLTPEAWDVRNFTALRTLDAVWRGLIE
jgi:hypothetical protein